MTPESVTNNGNSATETEVSTAAPPAKRLRASGPILILAVLFVMGAFLSWYFSWFGRELSDADITTYLADQARPRHVQHALLQVQQRIERNDVSVKRWYPQVVQLASSPEKEFRLTAGWLMGFDNQAPEFHEALRTLVGDREPIVRRNAALALIRFNDPSGRAELRKMLEPYSLAAPVSGVVASSLKEGARVARGTLLVRISESAQTAEVRSPLPGSLAKILAPAGAKVAAGDVVLTLNSDEDSVWEALRGLSVIGEGEDLAVVETYAGDAGTNSERIKKQAALTANAIKGRMKSNAETVKQ